MKMFPWFRRRKKLKKCQYTKCLDVRDHRSKYCRQHHCHHKSCSKLSEKSFTFCKKHQKDYDKLPEYLQEVLSEEKVIR